MIDLLLLIVGTGAIAYEVVYSLLAFHIKRLFLLHTEQPVIELLSTLKAYKKVLGLKVTSLFFPLILVVMILANLHRTIFKLLSCVYCTTFQLAFWTAFIWLQFPIVTCLFIAGTALIPAALYNLIRMKSI